MWHIALMILGMGWLAATLNPAQSGEIWAASFVMAAVVSCLLGSFGRKLARDMDRDKAEIKAAEARMSARERWMAQHRRNKR